MVSAAYAGRPSTTSRPRAMRPLALAAAAAAALVALAVALSPAGARMGRWIEQRFTPAPDTATPAFAELPGGRVLLVGRDKAWVARQDGSLQGVGAFSEAGWSPRGKFVIGVRGRRLVAVTPTGDLRWTVTRPRPVHHPAWSGGEGFRVAYLEGTTLRTVVGDGTGDRLVRRAAAPRHSGMAAGIGLGGELRRRRRPDRDRGRGLRRRLWARRTGGELRGLAWTRDGRRLVALFAGGLRVYDRRGRPLMSRPLGAPGRSPSIRAAAARPSRSAEEGAPGWST